MDIHDRQLPDGHYKNIYIQNPDRLKNGGTGDGFLLSPAGDTRMSVALLIRIGEAVSDSISVHLKKLKGTEPHLYYYPKEDLHKQVLAKIPSVDKSIHGFQRLFAWHSSVILSRNTTGMP